MSEPNDDALRTLKGLFKKHGQDAEVTLKVKKRTGHLISVGDETVGLRNSAWNADKWFDVTDIVDGWKKGSGA